MRYFEHDTELSNSTNSEKEICWMEQVEMYDSEELVNYWHGDSCSCEASLRYWNLIGRRFRGLSGVKTVENSRQQTKPGVNVTVASTGSHLSLLSLVQSRTKGARTRKIQK